MRRLLLPLLVLGTAGSAAAQSTFTVSPASIGKSECDANDTVTITLSARDGSSNPITGLDVSGSWTVWLANTASCTQTSWSDAELISDDAAMDVTGATSGTYVIRPGAQVIAGSVNGQDSKTCGGENGIDDTGYLCAKYGTNVFGPQAISVDTQPLAAPSITSVQAGDAKIRVRPSPASGDEVTGWRAFVRRAYCSGGGTGGGGGGGSGGGGSGGGGSGGGGSGGSAGELCGNEIDDDDDGLVDCGDPDCAGALRELGGAEPREAGWRRSEFGDVDQLTIDGLTNGVTYQVYVKALRESDVSPASDVVTGTPRAVTRFWETYQDAGGDETGCSAGAGAIALLGAAALLLLRRRGAGLLALALLLLASPARAEEGEGEVVRRESPRTGFFELKLGLDYYPSIDEEEGLQGEPFRHVFGKDERLMPQLTYERILWDGFGTLSAGLGAGYSESYAHAFYADQPTVRSSDVTSFHVVPLWAMGTYRFDWPAEKLGIPVVPFARAGLGYWLWWTSPKNGGRAAWMWSAGAALELDPFDPRLAREFDADAGVNASYLFVEYTAWTVDGFGSKGFDLSDKVLSLGLALAF